MLPPELSLGPFKIDRAGMLSPATPESFPRFGVRWRGRVLHTGMRQCHDHARGILELSIRIGRVPSSTGLGAEQRRAALALAPLLPSLLPDGWALQLLPDHALLLQTSLAIALPVSAQGLVTELTSFLLQLTPYLDELDAVGLCHPLTQH